MNLIIIKINLKVQQDANARLIDNYSILKKRSYN